MRFIVGILLLSIGSVAAYAKEITGTVIDVKDGDSFVIRDSSGKEITVRLAECDAPEYRQNYSSEARRHLTTLILGRKASVLTNDEDRYGRAVGRVYHEDRDINAAMVSAGLAWANLPYLTDRDFLALEAEARQARRGLWADRSKPLEPWLWRKSRRESVPIPTSPAPTSNCLIKGNVSADGKRRYHVPGSRSYNDTRIDARRGERWFCTEVEAQAAGWVRAGKR